MSAERTSCPLRSPLTDIIMSASGHRSRRRQVQNGHAFEPCIVEFVVAMSADTHHQHTPPMSVHAPQRYGRADFLMSASGPRVWRPYLRPRRFGDRDFVDLNHFTSSDHLGRNDILPLADGVGVSHSKAM